MADKKKQRQNLADYVRQELGGNINQEIRQLIDLAVRKQFGLQQFVERFSNTHYFHQQFPGLIEKDGTISNVLTGAQGVGVSASSLTSAISNYRKGLDSYMQIATNAGYEFNKQQYAAAIKAQVSGQEFAARINAIDTVDSNPELKNIFTDTAKRLGLQADHMAAYKAALHAGDRQFQDIYEAAQYQYQLGLNRQEATSLAKGKGGAVGGTSLQNIDQVVQAVRQNLQTIGPELAAQGISTPQLVKILNNPSAFGPEMQKIQQTLETRKSLYGNPVVGTYAQQGPAGGLSQFQPSGEQAYG